MQRWAMVGHHIPLVALVIADNQSQRVSKLGRQVNGHRLLPRRPTKSVLLGRWPLHVIPSETVDFFYQHVIGGDIFHIGRSKWENYVMLLVKLISRTFRNCVAYSPPLRVNLFGFSPIRLVLSLGPHGSPCPAYCTSDNTETPVR